MKWAAFAIAVLAISQAASAAPFTMVCNTQALYTVADGSRPTVNLPVLVYPEQGTVNGAPAAITDALITWTVSDPKMALSYVLDRKSKVLSIYDAAGSRLFAGACVAPGQQSAPAQPTPVSPVPPPPPRPQSLTLVCRLEDLGPLMSGHNPSSMTSFLVDPGSGTVNGYPATITDTHISWKDATNAGADTWIIDRASGGIAVISSRNIPILTGNCELSTARKF